MNNTPTPRTDAAAWPETDVVEASFARQLETELAAVTEQRDEYKLVLQSYDRHNHEMATKLEIAREQLKAEQENLTKSCMRERLADEDRKYVENQRDDAFFQLAEAQEKLAAVTEQRDEAREATAKWESSSDAMERAGAEQARRADENREWALRAERERDEAREQRDRLAEALEQWQPIETAPKDRSFILSAHPEHGYLITRWLEAREMWDGWAIEPTHWMSLPKLTTP